MSDTCLWIGAMRMPRRMGRVDLTMEDLFGADVNEADFFRFWSAAATRQEEALEVFERVARRVADHVAEVHADASLVSVSFEARYWRVILVVEHPSLDVVPEGTEIPVLQRMSHLAGPCPGHGIRGEA